MIKEVKEKLIEILSQFCPDNVYLQGTLNADGAYPHSFITFFTSMTDFDMFYDDKKHRADLYFSVMFYSDSPLEVETVPDEIIEALKNEGFIPENAGEDIMSDVATHTGWAMEFIYPYYNFKKGG